MSGYCGVASPLNEAGTAFAPDQPGLRNYAAAATLRMLNCVKASTASAEPVIEESLIEAPTTSEESPASVDDAQPEESSADS